MNGAAGHNGVALRDGSKIAGLVVGVVKDNNDPENRSRVKVDIPAFGDQVESAWAPVASPGAGITFLPEPGDTVLLAFAHGDVNRPYVLGTVQNGQTPPPYANADGQNNERVIQSRSGHTITFDDSDGGETITIVDASGENEIVIDTQENEIKIKSAGNIVLEAADGEIQLKAKTIAIESDQDLTLEAGGDLDATADGDMNLEGGNINLN